VIKEFHSPEFQRGLAALRKTAESGEVGDLLAVVDYLHGMGDEADREADAWYLKAAEKGSAKAMLHVGVSLFHGEYGPADKVAARQWMERAIQAGEPQAAAVMKLLFEGDASSQPVGAAK
jgi:TPR repeat protein